MVDIFNEDSISQTKEELEKILKWTNCRIAMLNIMELKLIEMKELTSLAKNNDLDLEERSVLQSKINLLEKQINGLDEESRKFY